ncbi:MAG: DUF4116 domain-containing protein [Parachlamydiaceae bacterium]|nr:DUF4116 domain-containing protein [Parachlamydiaceae bacterium]
MINCEHIGKIEFSLHSSEQQYYIKQRILSSKSERALDICKAIFFSFISIMSLCSLKCSNSLCRLSWRRVWTREHKFAAVIDKSFRDSHRVISGKLINEPSVAKYLQSQKAFLRLIEKLEILPKPIENTHIELEEQNHPDELTESNQGEISLEKENDHDENLGDLTSNEDEVKQIEDDDSTPIVQNKPSPAPSKLDNTTIVNDSQKELQSFVVEAEGVDFETVYPYTLKEYLDRIINSLGKDATEIEQLHKLLEDEQFKSSEVVNGRLLAKFKSKILEILLERLWRDLSLQSNREVMLLAVSINGRLLAYATTKLQGDKQIVTTALRNNGLALAYVSSEFRENDEFINIALSSNPCSIIFAPDRIKNDRDVVLKAVSSRGDAIQYVDEKFLDDKEIVLAAISKDGWGIFFISKRLKHDKDVMLAAVKQNKSVIGYVSEGLQEDPDILRASE